MTLQLYIISCIFRFKGGPSYPSPIVIVSAPESIKHINLTLVPLPGVASTVLDTPYKHYVQVSHAKFTDSLWSASWHLTH